MNSPNLDVELTLTGAFDWKWPTVAQTVGGQSKTISGGKVLGGSSSINGMEWSRGSQEQYDAIAALGNPGWGWTDFQSSMKKAERFSPPDAEDASRGASFDPLARGFNGLVGIGWPTPYQPYKLFQGFVAACAEVFGIATGKDLCGGDPNSATQNSFSLNQGGSNASAAVRTSSATAYLYPTLPTSQNPGLTVLTGTQATRILWDTSSTGEAVASGVAFANVLLPILTGQVTATKEVIVCGGAIMSPHFLMLSGVGDPKDLNAVGIPTVVNSPGIGKGAIVDRGAWTDVDGLETIFLAQADIINGSSPVAEFEQYGTALLPPDLVGGITWNLLPQTRGTVKLASADPFAYPLIDPAYLDADFDLTIQTACARALRKIFKTPVMSGIAAIEVSPGEFSLPADATDAQYAEYVKANYRPVYHPLGTVAMMPQAMGGSVGPDLKLYGVSNVRVVDASILPFQLSAHLSSTIYGVAEKGAKMILADAQALT
ncbi:hypothetical protein RQP46_000463 [Phenoliferia psychrophenolica]